MLAKTKSFGLDGLDGFLIDVEVDINKGIPSVETVGLIGTAIKESKERVRSAIKNSGLQYPLKKITINLAPADTKKEGPIYDLPIAISVLAASEQLIDSRYMDYIILGELSLDGTVRSVRGVMPILISAYERGFTKFIIPSANAKEASYIQDVEVYAVESLRETVDYLLGVKLIEPIEHTSYESKGNDCWFGVDYCDVKGQVVAKRALEIAVAGNHNVIMSGPPGTGKTMLAKCVPTIMPNMQFEEAIEVTKIHSIAGLINEQEGIIISRPFRTPHHTATIPALIGGGASAKPGEVSLAHGGVLFLDEMPEYTRHALESLRQPLEDKVVTVARAIRTVRYPANFMLVASMNPCPCGNFGSTVKECACTPMQIRNYRAKVSGPLLDRIDLHIEVDNICFEEYRANANSENSASVKDRVEKVRAIQRNRYKNSKTTSNAVMTNNEIKLYCNIDKASENLLERAFNKLQLSARGSSRILKVARTIADLESSELIKLEHLAEAIQYRALDRANI